MEVKRTELILSSRPFRFPGPGLKRPHPGSEVRSNKPPEPIISQIIDKLKHINQVSSVRVVCPQFVCMYSSVFSSLLRYV